jgi:hypothetical protein
MVPGTFLEFGDRGLSVVDPPAARGVQSSDMKTVWISLGAVLPVVLLIVAGIVVVVAHRRGASRTPTNRTESDGEAIPDETEGSLAHIVDFLSEENALSQDGDALIVAKKKLQEGCERSAREWRE